MAIQTIRKIVPTFVDRVVSTELIGEDNNPDWEETRELLLQASTVSIALRLTSLSGRPTEGSDPIYTLPLFRVNCSRPVRGMSTQVRASATVTRLGLSYRMNFSTGIGNLYDDDTDDVANWSRVPNGICTDTVSNTLLTNGSVDTRSFYTIIHNVNSGAPMNYTGLALDAGVGNIVVIRKFTFDTNNHINVNLSLEVDSDGIFTDTLSI